VHPAGNRRKAPLGFTDGADGGDALAVNGDECPPQGGPARPIDHAIRYDEKHVRRDH
jgi:hypothetical protein